MGKLVRAKPDLGKSISFLFFFLLYSSFFLCFFYFLLSSFLFAYLYFLIFLQRYNFNNKVKKNENYFLNNKEILILIKGGHIWTLRCIPTMPSFLNSTSMLHSVPAGSLSSEYSLIATKPNVNTRVADLPHCAEVLGSAQFAQSTHLAGSMLAPTASTWNLGVTTHPSLALQKHLVVITKQTLRIIH